MNIVFWGVRGSVPTPLTPDDIRRKISTAIARAHPDDLRDSASRERFLASLPPWLFGCTGSNTSCVEIRVDGVPSIVLDAGSGIRQMAQRRAADGTLGRNFHLFFSHFHYDHVQGLPFFAPAYTPGNVLHFYSPEMRLEAILRTHMQEPYFPVTMEGTMAARLQFHVLTDEPTRIGSATVSHKRLNHPGGAYAFKVSSEGRSVIYATDTELTARDFEKNPANMEFFRGADMVILDAQYTLGEAIEKYSWGHSSYSLGVDFAKAWNIRRLYLFHHEPQYDDRQLYKNLLAARWYAQRIGYTDLEIQLARESQTVEL